MSAKASIPNVVQSGRLSAFELPLWQRFVPLVSWRFSRLLGSLSWVFWMLCSSVSAPASQIWQNASGWPPNLWQDNFQDDESIAAKARGDLEAGNGANVRAGRLQRVFQAMFNLLSYYHPDSDEDQPAAAALRAALTPYANPTSGDSTTLAGLAATRVLLEKYFDYCREDGLVGPTVPRPTLKPNGSYFTWAALREVLWYESGRTPSHWLDFAEVWLQDDSEELTARTIRHFASDADVVSPAELRPILAAFKHYVGRGIPGGLGTRLEAAADDSKFSDSQTTVGAVNWNAFLAAYAARLKRVNYYDPVEPLPGQLSAGGVLTWSKLREALSLAIPTDALTPFDDVDSVDGPSDGLPDAWQRRIRELDPQQRWALRLESSGDLAGQPADSDRTSTTADGLTNFEEWLTGTNPFLLDSDGLLTDGRDDRFTIGLSGWWPLLGTGTTFSSWADRSVYELEAATDGQVVIPNSSSGPYEGLPSLKAPDLSGASGLVLPGDALDQAGALTIAVWVRLNPGLTAGTYVLMDSRCPADPDDSMTTPAKTALRATLVIAGSGDATLQLKNPVNLLASAAQQTAFGQQEWLLAADAAGSLAGQWHHLAFMRDPSVGVVRCWLDGRPLKERNGEDQLPFLEATDTDTSQDATEDPTRRMLAGVTVHLLKWAPGESAENGDDPDVVPGEVRLGGHLPVGGESPLNAWPGCVAEVRCYRRALAGQDVIGLVGDADATGSSAPAVYADSAADGLPDRWESQIVDALSGDGIITVAQVLPADDFDMDGISNLQEFLAGTDPTVATTPAAPVWTSVNAISPQEAQLAWTTDDPWISRIVIERRESAPAPVAWTVLGAEMGTSWLDGHLQPATPYQYRIKTVRDVSGGTPLESVWTESPVVTTLTAPLAPPHSVTGSSALLAVSGASITLQWSRDSASDPSGASVDAIRVRWGPTDPALPRTVQDLPGASTSQTFSISDGEGVTYGFEVQALGTLAGQSVTSVWSAPCTVTAPVRPPPEVTGLTAVLASDAERIDVDWHAVDVSKFDHLLLSWSSDGGTTWNTGDSVELDPGTASWTHDTLMDCRTYRYRIQGFNRGGSGTATASASVLVRPRAPSHLQVDRAADGSTLTFNWQGNASDTVTYRLEVDGIDEQGSPLNRAITPMSGVYDFNWAADLEGESTTQGAPSGNGSAKVRVVAAFGGIESLPSEAVLITIGNQLPTWRGVEPIAPAYMTQLWAKLGYLPQLTDKNYSTISGNTFIGVDTDGDGRADDVWVVDIGGRLYVNSIRRVSANLTITRGTANTADTIPLALQPGDVRITKANNVVGTVSTSPVIIGQFAEGKDFVLRDNKIDWSPNGANSQEPKAGTSYTLQVEIETIFSFRSLAVASGQSLRIGFGTAVLAKNDWLFVSAPGPLSDDATGDNPGAVYCFKVSNNQWQWRQTLEIDQWVPQSGNAPHYGFTGWNTLENWFGYSIDCDGTYLVIGSPRQPWWHASNKFGGAFVCQLQDQAWVAKSYVSGIIELTANNQRTMPQSLKDIGVVDKMLGYTVAVRNGVVAISAPGDLGVKPHGEPLPVPTAWKGALGDYDPSNPTVPPPMGDYYGDYGSGSVWFYGMPQSNTAVSAMEFQYVIHPTVPELGFGIGIRWSADDRLYVGCLDGLNHSLGCIAVLQMRRELSSGKIRLMTDLNELMDYYIFGSYDAFQSLLAYPNAIPPNSGIVGQNFNLVSGGLVSSYRPLPRKTGGSFGSVLMVDRVLALNHAFLTAGDDAASIARLTVSDPESDPIASQTDDGLLFPLSGLSASQSILNINRNPGALPQLPRLHRVRVSFADIPSTNWSANVERVLTEPVLVFTDFDPPTTLPEVAGLTASRDNAGTTMTVSWVDSTQPTTTVPKIILEWTTVPKSQSTPWPEDGPGSVFTQVVVSRTSPVGVTKSKASIPVPTNADIYVRARYRGSLATNFGPYNEHVAVQWDDDSDGLPDYWEKIYLEQFTAQQLSAQQASAQTAAVGEGLNPNDDLNGDGLTIAEEWAEGLNPTSPGQTGAPRYSPLVWDTHLRANARGIARPGLLGSVALSQLQNPTPIWFSAGVLSRHYIPELTAVGIANRVRGRARFRFGDLSEGAGMALVKLDATDPTEWTTQDIADRFIFGLVVEANSTSGALEVVPYWLSPTPTNPAVPPAGTSRMLDSAYASSSWWVKGAGKADWNGKSFTMAVMDTSSTAAKVTLQYNGVAWAATPRTALSTAQQAAHSQMLRSRVGVVSLFRSTSGISVTHCKVDAGFELPSVSGNLADWLTSYGLTNADLDLDLDGDGLSVLEEYNSFVSEGARGNPLVWDLDPLGDEDGDGVLNYQDANPMDSSKGILAVKIDHPTPGEVIPPQSVVP